MGIKKYILYCFALVLLTAVKAGAQDDGYTERAKKYIAQYAPYAIAEQKRAGVPASITLGQGILETEAGASELMLQANNHFGIKCKNGWDGETFMHDDDAPGECFKKYKCAEDSYKDHSDHLKRNQRYSPLFSIPETDYSGWAVCLKKCGYATNPQYAQRLIKIIEDFDLQQYTAAAMNNTAVPVSYKEPIVVQADPFEDTPVKQHIDFKDTTIVLKSHTDLTTIQKTDDSAQQVVTKPAESPVPAVEVELNSDSAFSNSKITVVNGLKAFYAFKGDMLLRYAVKYNVRYPKLLEMNDLPDGPLPFSMYVYVEKKKGVGTHVTHTVRQSESLLMISQHEGIQLKRLMALNLLRVNEEPATGAVLQLQTMATHKPLVARSGAGTHTGSTVAGGSDNAGDDGADFISTNKPKPAEPRHVPAVKPVPAHKTATTAPEKPAPPVRPVMTPKTEVVATEKPATTKEEEDLTALKAELDKAVYADDSKLIADNRPAVTEAPAKKATNEPAKGTKGAKTYTVKKGDTAFSIAKKHDITVAQLMKWNSMPGGDVKVGQTLRVKE